MINVTGLPGDGRPSYRVGTLNVGTMSGKGREVADLMVRRRVGVLCVQGMRWRGNKARELREGCRLLYSRANQQGRNGVGIILSADLRDRLMNMRSDWVMSVKLGLEDIVVNILSVCVPQVGCDEEETVAFWEAVDQDLSATSAEEKLTLGVDLNGHVRWNKEELKECMEVAE